MPEITNPVITASFCRYKDSNGVAHLQGTATVIGGGGEPNSLATLTTVPVSVTSSVYYENEV